MNKNDGAYYDYWLRLVASDESLILLLFSVHELYEWCVIAQSNPPR